MTTTITAATIAIVNMSIAGVDAEGFPEPTPKLPDN
jgi:hypothetical protein